MKNEKNGMNKVFLIVCGAYLLYLGIKIFREEGVTVPFMLVGGLFAVIGAGIILVCFSGILRGGMMDISGEETEQSGNPEEEPAVLAEADNAAEDEEAEEDPMESETLAEADNAAEDAAAEEEDGREENS